MKKLLTAFMATAIFSVSFAQVAPPKPPRPHHPAGAKVPPKPKAPSEVAKDVDNFLRTGEPRKANASDHKYVKYNSGKHKGQYKNTYKRRKK